MYVDCKNVCLEFFDIFIEGVFLDLGLWLGV